MALITCSECGRQISDKATACPGCGAPIEVLKPKVSNFKPAPDEPGKTEGDHIILAADGIAVSTARIDIRTTTYATRNITSSRILRVPKSGTGRIIAVVGAVIALPGLVVIALGADGGGGGEGGGVGFSFGSFVMGLVLLFAGVRDYMGRKDTYWIGITTSGSEVRAMYFKDLEVAQVVLAAINAAIAGKRVTMQWPEVPDTNVRSLPVAAVLIAVPIVLAFVHSMLFGASGMFPMTLLVVAGVIAALVVTLDNSLRTKDAREIVDVLKTNKVVAGTIAGVVLVAEVAAITMGVGPAMAKRRIDNAVSSEDPCVTVYEADLKYASSKQTMALDLQKDKCRWRTEDAERRQNEREREQGCTLVLSSVRWGKLTAEDEARLKSAAKLAQRISIKTVSAADLKGIGRNNVPCSSSKVGEEMWKAYVVAAVDSPNIWGEIKSSNALHSDLFSELCSGGYKLPPASEASLKATADPIIQRAAKSVSVADMAEGKRFCDLATGLKISGMETCAYLVSKFDLAKKAADKAEAAAMARGAAVAKANAAREEAAENARAARCEAVEKQRQACTRGCDNLLFNGNDEAALNCEDRCDRKFSVAGCD